MLSSGFKIKRSLGIVRFKTQGERWKDGVGKNGNGMVMGTVNKLFLEGQ
jgi:hypothetical protein